MLFLCLRKEQEMGKKIKEQREGWMERDLNKLWLFFLCMIGSHCQKQDETIINMSHKMLCLNDKQAHSEHKTTQQQ